MPLKSTLVILFPAKAKESKDSIEAGMINKKQKVKILAKGELTAKLNVEAHAFSKTAQEAIEKAGGTVKIVE